MQLAHWILQQSGKPYEVVFDPVSPLVALYQPPQGQVQITHWDEAGLGGLEQPSMQKITAILAMDETPDVVVPASVTRAQAKIALLRAGKLDAVKAAVAQAGGEIEIWFDDASTWERENPHVIDLGTSLGLSSADIDGLFVAAGQIAA